MRAHAERHSQSNGILLTPIFRPSEGEAPKPTITGAMMRQIEKKIKSNRNWNTTPPPRDKPREFDVCLGGWRKLNWKCKIQKFFCSFNAMEEV